MFREFAFHDVSQICEGCCAKKSDIDSIPRVAIIAIDGKFGNLGRNALRGPDFAWGDFYLTKWFTLREHVKLRIEAQAFNLFNHPNFALPTVVYAGIPGKPSTQTGFGALTYTTAPPTGLLGVGLGGDSSPRMIAFQARLEF